MSNPSEKDYAAYLFVYFTGNRAEQQKIYYATSLDGYNFKALNAGKPVLESSVGTKCLRDPHILRGEDGRFYLTATDLNSEGNVWVNDNLVSYVSDDLISWHDETLIPICNAYDLFMGGDRAWAPQSVYDREKGMYMVYFSVRVGFVYGGDNADRIYCIYTKDFKTFEGEPQLLFESPVGGSVIDGDIVEKDGRFYLFFKQESTGGIALAVSDHVSGPYTVLNSRITPPHLPVEGSCTYKLFDSDKYLLIYDCYTSGRYGAHETENFETFVQLGVDAFNLKLGSRHGTVIPITKEEYDRLDEHYGVKAVILPEQIDPTVTYELNETGGGVARDSASGKNAVLHGAYFTHGRDESAACFDGNGAYISLHEGIVENLSDFTVSTWIYAESSEKWQRVFDFGNNTTAYMFFTPYNESGLPQFSITIGGGNGEYSVVGAERIPVDKWVHVAVTLRGKSLSLYVGGVLTASKSKVQLHPFELGKTQNNYLGRSQYQGDPYFCGMIDGLYIYNRALGDAEVAYLAEATTDITSVYGYKVKTTNVFIDKEKREVLVPIVPGTALCDLGLTFTLSLPGASIRKIRDFDENNTAHYLISGLDGDKEWSVKAIERGNSIVGEFGYYADTEIAAFDGKYYLYPTSDGFDGWGGYYFECFSSSDLVNWTSEGLIFDLTADTKWSGGNAWAPCIIRKFGKYFYYYSANQEKFNPWGGKCIGIAVANSPTGPFRDPLGQPLVYDGMTVNKEQIHLRGQTIDPAAFTDPETGKSYLYWGNGTLYAAELDERMTKLKTAPKAITPEHFREGVYVFCRKGKYYFTWSEDDTRSPNYCVYYGVSDSPLGPISGAAKILSKNEKDGIFGTGHHSILNIPGSDEWYICYHRFNHPTSSGDRYSDYYGTHREACLDKLEFDEDGNIRPVTPTLSGVMKPVTYGGAALSGAKFENGAVTARFTNINLAERRYQAIAIVRSDDATLKESRTVEFAAHAGGSADISIELRHAVEASDSVSLIVWKDTDTGLLPAVKAVRLQ